jgi:hypothetical protein
MLPVGAFPTSQQQVLLWLEIKLGLGVELKNPAAGYNAAGRGFPEISAAGMIRVRV